MSITFQCEHCHKEVKAPDTAAGKRGKCPHCQQSCYIPAPVSDDELYDIAPLDEEGERKREEELRRIREQEKELRFALKELFDDESALQTKIEQLVNMGVEGEAARLCEFCLRSLQGLYGRCREVYRGKAPPEAKRCTLPEAGI